MGACRNQVAEPASNSGAARRVGSIPTVPTFVTTNRNSNMPTVDQILKARTWRDLDASRDDIKSLRKSSKTVALR